MALTSRNNVCLIVLILEYESCMKLPTVEDVLLRGLSERYKMVLVQWIWSGELWTKVHATCSLVPDQMK